MITAADLPRAFTVSPNIAEVRFEAVPKSLTDVDSIRRQESKDASGTDQRIVNEAIKGINERNDLERVELGGGTLLGSQAYRNFRMKKFIFDLSQTVDKLVEFGVVDGIAHVVEAKKLVEAHSKYFVNETNTRMLMSYFELLFSKSHCLDLDEKRVSILRSEIRRFEDGRVDSAQLDIFARQLYRTSILSLDHGAAS